MAEKKTQQKKRSERSYKNEEGKRTKCTKVNKQTVDHSVTLLRLHSLANQVKSKEGKFGEGKFNFSKERTQSTQCSVPLL